MKSQLNGFRGAIVLLAGLLLLAGCGHTAPNSADASTRVPPVQDPVRYVKVVTEKFPEILELTAKVEPDPTQVIRIFPPASGRVVAIEVRPGDRVRKGETVATLSSSDVASARADFAKAQVEADRTTRETSRQKLLLEHGAIAEKDYLDTRAQADAAQAELARAKQKLSLLNISPADSSDVVTLVAPASGVVLDVSAAPGEFSKSLESANPLITIADLSTVWIAGEVYEKDISRIRRGDWVDITLEAYPGKSWKGRISAISGTLDPTTRTLTIRIVLPNPESLLKPEMFGTIHVDAGAHQALVVPAAAIIREGNAATVFVRNAGNPQQRAVTVGQVVDGKIEIVQGLKDGEEVAADGAELLKGGANE